MHEYSEDLQTILSTSLEWKEQFPSQLFQELNVHPVHLQSIGVWPSTALVQQLSFTTRLDLPDISSAIVIPCYGSDLKLTNLELISYNKAGRIQFDQVGQRNLGWFNYLPSYQSVLLAEQKKIDVRLTVFENLQSALTQPSGVFSRNVSQANLNQLDKITYKLALKGSQEFLKRFERIEGFDITLGNTGRSVWDVLKTDFIFSDLLGLDLRAILPRARDYAKNLPLHERESFNTQLKQVLKVDLKATAPLLFEQFNDERTFIERLRGKVIDSCILRSAADNFLTDSSHYTFTIKDRPFKIHLTSANVIRCFAAAYGDVLEWVQQVSPIPLRYWWDMDKESRVPRAHVYEIIKETLFQLVLELLHESKAGIYSGGNPRGK